MMVCSALFCKAMCRIQGQVSNAESILGLLLGSELAQGFLAAYKCLLKSGSALLDLASVAAGGTFTFSKGAQA